jgi:hypothetical protein
LAFKTSERPDVQPLLPYSALLALAALLTGAIATVALALKHGGRREESADDHDALAASRFTIPVSVIVPLDENSPASREQIAALLGISYPEFEVILVADDSASTALDAIKGDWDLSAHEFFYRQSLSTAAVQRIYRSSFDPRLMLVEKTAAGRADALNCGINLARFRYAGVVDAGVVFEPDALLRAMSAPLKDPARIVAASSHVETRPNADERVSADAARQQLESIRSLMESRNLWRTTKNGLGPERAMVVWRRDALLRTGGFSTDAVDPDLDMMRRLQTSTLASEGSAAGAVVRTTTMFGRVDPRSRADDLAALSRRQRAVLETVGAWNGGPGPTLAYFVVSELLTPLLEVWVVLAMGISAAAGWTSWGALALSVILLSLRRALVTSAALLVRGTAAGAPDERTLRRLLLLAPCEFAWYGAGAAVARLNGAWAFVTGHAGTAAEGR